MQYTAHSTSGQHSIPDQQPAMPAQEPEEPEPVNLSVVAPANKISPDINRHSYSKLTDLHRISSSEVLELGLKVNSTNLEVHLLHTKDNCTSLITKVELTGMRGESSEYNFEYQSYSISVKKSDRGKLFFRLMEPQLQDACCVAFTSQPRVGEIHVTIDKAKLDESGRRKFGASNRQVSALSVERLPIHKPEIADFIERLESKSYRLKGLADPDSIADFCSGMQDVFESWSELKSRERIFKIRQLANGVLTNAGIPACFFPEGEIANWDRFSPDSLSRFLPEKWSIYRSPAFVDRPELTEAEKRQFLSDFFKTLVEVQQSWLLLRYTTTNQPDFLDSLHKQSQARRLQLSKIIKLAKKFPVCENEPDSDYCKKLLLSYSRAPGSLFASATTERQSLRFSEKLKSFFGRPYLLHKLDALNNARQALKLYMRSI